MHTDMNLLFKVTIILSILILGFVIFRLLRPYAHPPGPRIIPCKENLEHLYDEINLYRNKYGTYPEELDILQQFYSDRLGEDFDYILFCPGGDQEGYYQYDPEGRIEIQGKTPILWDNNRDNHIYRYWRFFHKEAGNVLFQDGSIETFEGNEWEEFLEKVEDIKTENGM